MLSEIMLTEDLPMASRKTRRQRHNPVKNLLKWLATIIVIMLLAGGAYVGYAIHQAPTITESALKANPSPGDNQVYVTYDNNSGRLS